MRRLAMLIVLLSAAPAAAQWRYNVVADLADGVAVVPPGRHEFSVVLRIGPRQRLTGEGTLVWTGDPAEHYPIRFGAADVAQYFSWVEGIALEGGGFLIERFGQHSGFRRVVVTKAPADAFRIEGPGDYFALVDCVAWGAAGDGFRIASPISNNGLKLIRCNGQVCGGAGLRVEPGTRTGNATALRVVDSVFQSNQAAKPDGEIVLDGWVKVSLEGSYIEPRAGLRGLVVRDRVWATPQGTPLRRVPGLRVDWMQIDKRATPAVEIAACVNPRFNDLLTAGEVRFQEQTYNGGVDSSRPVFSGEFKGTLRNLRTGALEAPRHIRPTPVPEERGEGRPSRP